MRKPNVFVAATTWWMAASCIAFSMTPCAAQAKVLMLTKSAGFTHPVVQRAKRGEAAWAEHNLQKFAGPQFVVDCSQDCADINADNLRNYAAVVFYTTGELPISTAGLDALFAFVRKGGGFVGVHSATDTLYKNATYGEMIGGYFLSHPWNKRVGILVEDPSHPATALFGSQPGGRFQFTDEIYQFKDFQKEQVRVLMRLDPANPDIDAGAHKESKYYPLAWCRDYGKGRVFYTALGHRREVWVDRGFLKHLTSGIRWAMRAEQTLARPPRGASVLFDGEDLSRWTKEDGVRPAAWDFDLQSMTCARGAGSIISKQKFGDCRIHVEFKTPHMPDKSGQGRGNSGVYIQRRYEVQILDSYGKPAAKNDCAAIYNQRAPDANVCRKPGEWQTYDIWFTAPRFDTDGKKVANARLSLIHNDVIVHDDVEIRNKTGAGRKEGPEKGSLLLQDHGNPVSFRNVWVLPDGR